MKINAKNITKPVFFPFEQVIYLHIEPTKSQKNKKLITTKLTANSTRSKKLQTPGM